MDNQYQHWVGKKVTEKASPYNSTWLVLGISSTGLAYLENTTFGDVHRSQIDNFDEVEKARRDFESRIRKAQHN